MNAAIPLAAPLRLSRTLALAFPAGAMSLALIAQYGFGLAPCEMCWWQRYAHIAALILALAAWVVPAGRSRQALVWLALTGIAASGLIGGFHAGVEYHWWQGFTSCATTRISGNPLDAIMNTPVVRCDVPAWTLFGVSMAGYNFIASLVAATGIAMIARHGR